MRKRARLLTPILILVAGAIWAIGAVPAWAGDYQFWYTKPYCLPTHKIFRETPAPSGTRKASDGDAGLPYLDVSAAQAEFEGRQIAVRPLTNLTGFWVEPGDLEQRDASGNLIASIPADDASAHWVYFHYVRRRSSGVRGYKVPGYIPDALPPFKLADGRTKKIGPAAGRTAPVYVLFKVPDGTPPGYYTGYVTLHADSTPDIRIPVRLRVYGFSIKAQRLRTSFGMSLFMAKKVNSPWGTWVNGPTGPYRGYHRLEERTLYGADTIGRWMKFMSEHRLAPQTLAGAWGWVDSSGHHKDGPMSTGYMPTRAGGYLQDYLSSGQATTFDGERFAFNNATMPDGSYWPYYVKEPFSSRSNMIKAARHYRSMKYALWPWRRKSVVYIVDEPSSSRRGFVERYGAFVHTYARGYPFMVTIDPARFGYRRFRNVDIYVNKLHFWWRDRYRWINPIWRSGRKVWQYSHSTNHQNVAPLYLLDKATVDSRIQGWFAYKTRANGVLYFSVNRWRTPYKGSRTYQDPYRYPLSCVLKDSGRTVYANGEGQLLYPGFYPALGLDVMNSPPVSSLRMEALRDGLEDYEYFKALELKNRSKARSDWYVRKMVTDKLTGGFRPGFPWYSKSAYKLQHYRDRLGSEIER